MSVWRDLEQVCGTIKHAPDQIDLDAVRVVCRRAQDLCELVAHLRSDPTIRVSPVDEGGSRVSITFDVPNGLDWLRRLAETGD